MANKIPLSSYAESHEINYRTALRKFKDGALPHVSEYITEDAGETVRYFVVDNSPDIEKVVKIANEIVDLADKIKEKANLMKQNLK